MRQALVGALIAASVPICAHAAAQASDARAAAIVAQVRSATFSRPVSSVTWIHSRGVFEAFGIRGTQDEWIDVAGRRFAQRQSDSGPLTGASGWDGTSAWNEDASGNVHIDGGRAGRYQAINQAYSDSYAFLQPNFGGGTAEYAGTKSEGGKPYDVVRITPKNGTPLSFWVDLKTHLIAKEIIPVGITTTTAVYSDYRRFDGVLFPMTANVATNTGNNFVFHTSSVSFNQPAAALMNVPPSTNKDASIAGGSSTTVPIKLVNNHIFVNVMLNGKGPYTFAFDTGGALIVSSDVAKALHESSSGGAQIGGVGSATETAGFTHLDSVSIGKATISNQYALVLPIAQGFGVAEGMHVDGLIGYETAARFLTTIDYADSTVTFAALPSAPASVSGATAVPFIFDNTIPRLAIAIDGVKTSAEVDTGNRASLSLSSPFLEANPSIAARATTAVGVDGFGVGGPSMGKLGRIDVVQIGPFSLHDTVATFATQTAGAFADPFNPANIGGGIWRRFTVTLDYPHQQMLLAPNAAFDSPFQYDRSGLFLINKAGSYAVLDVRAGTPAAAAGLSKGDIISTINGAPATDDTLSQVREVLSGPAGTVVHLHVKGPEGERDVALTLKDYV